MAAHGRLGAQARRRQIRRRVILGHPDGAGGLRPLGAFFLHQSLVAAVLAAYLVVWLVLITIPGGQLTRQYGGWTTTFSWMVAAAILIEIVTFLAPMKSIHTSMRAEKESELWHESDRLALQIEEIRGRLKEANVSDRRDEEASWPP